MKPLHPNEPVGAAEPSLQDRIFLKQPDKALCVWRISCCATRATFRHSGCEAHDVACDQARPLDRGSSSDSAGAWAAAGSEDTELGIMMEPGGRS